MSVIQNDLTWKTSKQKLKKKKIFFPINGPTKTGATRPLPLALYGTWILGVEQHQLVIEVPTNTKIPIFSHTYIYISRHTVVWRTAQETWGM